MLEDDHTGAIGSINVCRPFLAFSFSSIFFSILLVNVVSLI
jgi:hypothetical protein